MTILNLNDEQKRALERLLSKRTRDNMAVNAVYIHPAAQLRRQADEIEQDEADTPILRGLLDKLQKP